MRVGGKVVLVFSFNLVIERLLISGPQHWGVISGAGSRFNLVIERLLISGAMSAR